MLFGKRVQMLKRNGFIFLSTLMYFVFYSRNEKQQSNGSFHVRTEQRRKLKIQINKQSS